MKLGDLFENVPEGAAEIEVSGLTADSRKVEPGNVFAALSGVAADGRDF
ncbi:MAG: Mur ligase domain-containing protein, partial [Pseudomonadota bacterium]